MATCHGHRIIFIKQIARGRFMTRRTKDPRSAVSRPKTSIAARFTTPFYLKTHEINFVCAKPIMNSNLQSHNQISLPSLTLFTAVEDLIACSRSVGQKRGRARRLRRSPTKNLTTTVNQSRLHQKDYPPSPPQEGGRRLPYENIRCLA